MWDNFKARHTKILVMSYSTTSSDPVEYFVKDIFSVVEEFFTTNYCAIEERFAKEISKSQPEEQGSITPHVVEQKFASSIKLPKIALEKFSGDYRKWPTFHDLFKSLVHENKSLSPVQKLQYLKLHLSGEPENLLRHVQVTDNNYNSAWTLLTDRYDNKRVLVNTHLKVLFGQNSVSAESSQGIKALLDTTMESLQALKNLSIDVSGWDPILVFLLVQKLPAESHELWEREVSKVKNLPSWEELSKFLEARFRTLEAVSSKRSAKERGLFNQTKNQAPRQTFHVATKMNCVICFSNHSIRQCPTFSAANALQRLEIVKAKGLCINCLGSGHILASCPSQQSCLHCNKRHHSLLHRKFGEAFQPQTVRNPVNEGNPPNATHVTATTRTALSATSPDFVPSTENPTTALFANETCRNQVLLATACVKIISSCGEEHTARALIDQGSQSSFVTENLVQRLQLKKERIYAEINGVGKSSINRSTAQVYFTLKPLEGNELVEGSGLVLKKITNVLPATHISIKDWNHLKGLNLADPQFHKPGPIDLLLGADIYGEILLNGLVKGINGSPTAQNTIFGWVLTGKTARPVNKTISVNNFHTYTELHNLLQKFWEIEEIPDTKIYTEEENLCEELFANTTRKLENGRYEVELPLKQETANSYLGRSRHIAISRLYQLESRFKRDISLKEAYTDCMKEYIRLGHMTKVSSGEEDHVKVIENVRSYHCSYLPHHAVIKESSSTTKLRVVFDASRTTCSGISLNDRLMKGPVLQDELAALLLRWKLHKVVFTTDIEKMYRQIQMRYHHCNYQRIVWRESPQLPIEDFKLRTVTFGTKSAPYLATKVVQQLANDERDRFSMASTIALNDFYVDDLLSGTDTIESALEAQQQLIEMMKAGGFSLRKWSSNYQALLRTVPSTDLENNRQLKIKDEETVRTLGLYWNPSHDYFSYFVSLDQEPPLWTKRSILSDISKVFDPLGWISPCLVIGKMFLQKLWLTGIEWDDKVTPDLEREWRRYRESLKSIESFRLSRWVHYTKPTNDIEIHGFSDASQEAYAAVVYICTTNQFGERHVALMTSKTKVRPVKTVSVPRLELCAAALLAKLIRYVLRSIKLENVSIHAWTDSEIVLAWLKSHPSKWKTFVANRVSQIQQLLGGHVWSHVVSKENPADCASRGLYPTELLQHTLWWNGPDWLWKSEESWPKRAIVKPINLEIRRTETVTHHSHISLDWDTKYSSLDKLLRITAYCLRFISNLKQTAGKRATGYLKATEIQQALNVCIKAAQLQHFDDDVKLLTQGQPVSCKSKLKKLTPVLDANGLIRVGGRLEFANLDYSEKHPIILPDKCHLSSLIIDKTHKDTLHGGLRLMMNTIGKQYWLINARNAIRHHVHKCIVCYRYKANAQTQLMGNLPLPRVTANRPFSHTGIDYCGPFELKTHKGRNAKKYKAYIALFICMSVKAIHLELVTDLSAEGFIAAFRRFCARRGKCSDVYCDCGTNFVGASKALSKLQQQMVQQLDAEIGRAIESEGVRFHFIPPASPHFGGLWESGVRSTKFHLRRVLGNHVLTFEEFNTILTQIEACLNSRPLCEKSSDPQDLNPLTPAHFLIGDNLLTPPEPSLLDININRLDRWQFLQRLYQSFWHRWNAEYLCRLQQRPKWATKTNNVKIGDLVLLKHEELPPCRWALARIIQTHPGTDGLVRVVTLRTQNSVLKRPVAKICVLPIPT